MATLHILKYEALDKNGNKVRGEFIGSREELLNLIRRKGYILIKVQEQNDNYKRKNYKLKEFLNDLENLQILLESGTPLEEALDTIIKSSNHSLKLKFWESVRSEIRQGKKLSDALALSIEKFRLNFFPHFLSLIRAAENVGELKRGIQYYSLLLNEIYDTKQKIKNALSYPVFLLLMTVLVLLIIFLFIIPRFSSIFSPSDITNLPLVSKIEIELGKWIETHRKESLIFSLTFILLLLTIPVLVVKRFSKPISKIPLIKDIVLYFDFANLFNILSLSLKSGLTLTNSLELSKDILISEKLKFTIERTVKKIQEGNSLSEAIKELEIIPEEVKTVIETSEKTASLGKAFSLLSKRYKEKLHTKIENLTRFLEPSVIIIIGIIIGIIIFGIMNAILSISDII